MRHHAWTDDEILKALDLIDHEGRSPVQAAAMMGKTEGQIVGIVWRVKKEAKKADPDENQNGTMPRKWWMKRKVRT